MERSYTLPFPVLHEKQFPFTLLDVLATYERYEERVKKKKMLN